MRAAVSKGARCVVSMRMNWTSLVRKDDLHRIFIAALVVVAALVAALIVVPHKQATNGGLGSGWQCKTLPNGEPAICGKASFQDHDPLSKGLVIAVAADGSITATSDGKPISCAELNDLLAARGRSRTEPPINCSRFQDHR